MIESPDVLGVGDRDGDTIGKADLLNRRCSINGTPVHPDVAMKAMITGRIRRAVIDADDVTINLGRTQRLFTGKAREAAQLLAVTCTHRGCDIPAKFCDVDHREGWMADNGTTDQQNAMPLCGVHDRWKHTNKIRSRRATNGRIYLIRSDGATIKPIGQNEPEWSEPEWSEPPPTAPPSAQNTTYPWASFGRTMTSTELATRRIDPAHGWDIRIVDLDDIRGR